MLQDLVRLYAIRAREFSDAVASLGRHDHIGPEFLGLLSEIDRRHAICNAARDELNLYIDQAGFSSSANR